LLLKFDEANGSTTTIDSSRVLNNISCNNLSITSAQSKLNPTSGYFNGSSTYISIPDTEFLNFGTNDWTIDFWFMGTTTPSGLYPQIIGTQTGWNDGAITLKWDNAGEDRKISFIYNTSGTAYVVSSNILNFNQWYHVAVTRNKNYIYLYIDGVLHNSLNCGYAKTFDFCYGGSCRIGGGNWDGSNGYYLGYLSELRISRKIIRWNSNFTPPTTPYEYPPTISKVILSEQQNQLIDACDQSWTTSTDITCSLSQIRTEGYYSVSLSIGTNFTTGKIAYKTLSSQLDLSSYQKISFFYASNANHATNIFKICLCSDQSGDTIIDEFIIPVVTGMSATIEFIPITIDKAANLGSNINSIAIYAISDPGTIVIYLDNIISCKSGNSLSLKSAVSKNTNSEPWCMIDAIYNNNIFINQYFGANETVDTYHRELFELESQSDNYLQVSGTNGNVIKYQGGYNTSTDLIDGETYFRCRTGFTALHTNGQDNIVLDKISVLGAGTGLYITGSVNCDISMNNIINTSRIGPNSLYINTSYNNKINIKNLLYFNNINITNSDNNIINIKKHNLNLTHSGYNNKIYASQNADPNIKQYNIATNSKLYLQDFESNQSVDFIQTTNDNSVIYTTRLYREDDKNFITRYDGQVSSQTIIRHTNTGLAWKLYLTNTVNQYVPLKLSILKLAVKANKLVTVSCYLYRDSPLITGALVCERWQLNGIDQDAIAYTSLLNSWEQLQITFTPTQEGVVEVHAYAYGTATYSIYVDDILFTQAS